MNGIITVTLFIVLSLFAVNSLGEIFQAQKVTSLEENKKNFEQHKCGVPRPEFIYISERLENYSNSLFDPPAVLVYQCSRATGCCAEGENCEMAAEEKVIFTVQVMDDDDFRPLSIILKNHTSCECVAQQDNYSQPSDDESTDNSYNISTVAIVCSLISFFLLTLIALAIYSFIQQLKERRKATLVYEKIFAPQVDIEMTKPYKSTTC